MYYNCDRVKFSRLQKGSRSYINKLFYCVREYAFERSSATLSHPLWLRPKAIRSAETTAPSELQVSDNLIKVQSGDACSSACMYYYADPPTFEPHP